VNCNLSSNPPGREFAFVDKSQNRWQHLISNCSYDYIYIEKGGRKGYVGETVDKDEDVYRLFLSEGVWK
jgi:hypothetical protein